MHASRRRHPTQDEGRPFEAPGLRGGSEKFAMPCLTAHGSRRFAPRSSLAYQWIRCAAKSSPRRTGLNRGFRFGFRLALTWSSPFVICRTLRRLARARCGNFARCGQQHVAADDFIADTARGRGPRLDHRLRAEAALFRLELFFRVASRTVAQILRSPVICRILRRLAHANCRNFAHPGQELRGR
jgi:hypothetical protein